MAGCVMQGRKARLEAQEEAIHRVLAQVEKVVMVMSGKGGVGKSSIAVRLALFLAKTRRVGLLDLDLHAPSVPGMLGLNGRRPDVCRRRILPLPYSERLKVISVDALLPDRDASVTWRGPMKVNFIRRFLADIQWGPLNHLIIDAPPGTGDEPLTVAKVIPQTSVVIVTTPQQVSLADVRKSIDFCRRVGLRILGVIENMSGFTCGHCGGRTHIFKKGGGEEMAASMGVPFLGRLPIDPAIVEATDSGRPDLCEKEGGESAALFGRILAGIKKGEDG